jgi:hypothetical protein
MNGYHRAEDGGFSQANIDTWNPFQAKHCLPAQHYRGKNQGLRANFSANTWHIFSK